MARGVSCISIYYWPGKTHFVDAVYGDDARDGLSTATAWKTISKVNGHTFTADDRILFKRGCTWYETLTVPNSGTAGHPILIAAYGTGERPIIDAQHTRDNGIVSNGQRYITVLDVTIQNAIYDSIQILAGADNWTIQRCAIHAGNTGVLTLGQNTFILDCELDHATLVAIYGHQDGAGLHVCGCSIHHTHDNGIKVMGDNGIFEYNEIHHCDRSGFYMVGDRQGSDAEYNTLRYNWCHDNGQNPTDPTHGAEYYSDSADHNTYLYNIAGPGSAPNYTLGYWLDYGSCENLFYGNLAYHMRGALEGKGFKIENGVGYGTSLNNIYKNNIVYDCYMEALEVILPTTLQGNVWDHNVYYRGPAPHDHDEICDMRLPAYVSLATWQASTGNPDAHSVNGDPLLRDPAHGDFTLLPGSAAIDQGENLGATYHWARKPTGGVDTQPAVGAWDAGVFLETQG